MAHKAGDIVEVVSSVESDEDGNVKKVNHEGAIVVGYDSDSETYSLVKLSDLPGVYESGDYSSQNEAGVGAVKKAASPAKKPATSTAKKK